MLHVVISSTVLVSGFMISLPSTPSVLLDGKHRPCMMMAGIDAVDFPVLDGKDVRIGIIRARWHSRIVDTLVDGAKESLKECGVPDDSVIETEVPGSFELPLAARYLALSGQVDAILPVGVLIKGDTYHFEVIADQVTRALMDVGLQTGVPVVFGVITANSEAQAVDRSIGANNHGLQWGKTAVEMALLRSSAIGKKGKKFFLGFGEEIETQSSPQKDIGRGKTIGF